MNSVLLQEETAPQTTLEEGASFSVDITVLSDGTFVPYAARDFQVAPDAITLIGSGGPPREFLLTFELSSEAVQEGYRFANPALKFFQGGSKNSGFRVPPNPDAISATVSLFNTKRADDPPSSDEFSLLLVHPSGKLIPHDPSIFWEPPLG
jgi:hypothetical protein